MDPSLMPWAILLIVNIIAFFGSSRYVEREKVGKPMELDKDFIALILILLSIILKIISGKNDKKDEDEIKSLLKRFKK